MKINIFKSHSESSKAAATVIENIIKNKSNSVLGLATGSSPEIIYETLVEKNKTKTISFANVSTYNLDEYVGLEPTHKKSYSFFMNQKFFNHIDININNTFVPSGIGNPIDNANLYEKMLSNVTIDLQLLGIGTNAHIGFNEPGSAFDSQTREVDLTEETIEANKRFFNTAQDVPKTAISMGIGSIMKAKKIILIASGRNKAQAIKDTVEGEVNIAIPSSILQNHPNVELFLDEDAAFLLSKKG